MAFATRIDPELLDEEFQRWKRDPQSVDGSWSAFFEGFELGNAQPAKNGAHSAAAPGLPAAGARDPQTRVNALIYAYRTLGHTIALLDPLGEPRPEQPELSLEELGLAEADLETVVSSPLYAGGRSMPLRQMIDELRAIYSSSIGVEYQHIQNSKVRHWIRGQVEGRLEAPPLSADEQKRTLRVLMEAASFETFLHTRYIGQKRFSLEGGESLIVALDAILQDCPELGFQEIVMGMAHRGRLNVLANFLQKSLRTLFTEFSENYMPNLVGGDGDVKYHLGYSSTRKTVSGQEIHILLSANPSHLEAVDPVVEGKARARQRVLQDTAERGKVLPLLLHGDAAFAGQGVVAEVLNLSQLPGYKTGGTVHIIVNNQIGFTTLPADARSSNYATDVAKMIEAPIFHVNGDDPLAVRFVTEVALRFRQQFKRDVVIDLYCYRRHGHNEGDEPVFTQPALYKTIGEHPRVSDIFEKKLIESGVIPQAEADQLEREFQGRLEAALAEVKAAEQEKKLNQFADSTAVFQPTFSFDPVDTTVTAETIAQVARALTTTPPDFHVLPKIKRMLLDRRRKVHEDGGPFDWSYAESLAFGTLLAQKIPVRLSGQDSRRGTFSQRHSVLYDENTRDRYFPLRNICEDQASFCVYNSFLSEAAVLGFDYGYSLEYDKMLCLWEAQFGDFSNGAQVIIDQFIVSAESKWQRPSGIVMLLPHGYEGQGPEHSSARLERYLQLCAENNIQVVYPSTPAQYFHVLRRQMLQSFRKPLIVMTPKSLLRQEKCVSRLEDFTSGGFSEILPDPAAPSPKKVDRVILCSGKVYYDLQAHREERKIKHVALLRVEQLYPLHRKALESEIRKYGEAKIVWCQEESQNMGAWTHMSAQLRYLFNRQIWYAGRNASSSPAVGSLAVHKREQKLIVEDAFNL